MYKTIGQAIELANGIKRELVDIENVDIVLCPPFIALEEVGEIIYETNIKLGAQDMHWQEEGAFTGEISGVMLKDVGCQYVIIGHSERRLYFGETNESVNKKILAALKHDLIPIVCVGENLAQRENNQTFQIIKDHIEGALKGLRLDEVGKLVIAYEPVWAIGTGKNATGVQAQEAQQVIRKLLAKLYDEHTADVVCILYGGSVKPENIGEIIIQPDVDGALVGGASLETVSFSKIVKSSGVKIK